MHRLDHCLNCGATTPGAFCGECGQRNQDLHVSFAELAGDLLGEAFEVDSRIARTLVPFVAQPGLLTVEHNAGRRVRYSSPLRLYLFASFALFIALQLAVKQGPTINAEGAGAVQIDVGEAPRTKNRDATHVDGLGPLNQPMQEKIESYKKLDEAGRKEFRTRTKDRMLDAAPKVLFVLLPIFALLLKLLWRKRLYLEHLTFAFHTHAFGCLAVLPSLFVDTTSVILGTALLLTLYVVLALKRVYAQGWLRTLLKSSVLATAYLVVASLAFAADALIGLWQA